MNKDEVRPPPFINDEQLAVRWGMSAKTLRNLRVAGGHVPFVRLGRLVRYRLSDVEAWERDHTCASTSDKKGGRA